MVLLGRVREMGARETEMSGKVAARKLGTYKSYALCMVIAQNLVTVW